MATLPKAKVAGLAVRVMVAAAPVPDSEMVVGELVALLEMLSRALAVPVAAGANVMEYWAVAFGARRDGYEG